MIKSSSKIKENNICIARKDEFQPLSLGRLSIWPPVVLAPMAGVTNASFRCLCREFGAGLYVSEMITSRLLVEKHLHTLKLAGFYPGEKPRSIQLYGVDPYYLGKAAAYLKKEYQVDHIDLNFGCPVPKITRKGGGSAIPLKPKLFRKLIQSVVQHAGDIPVTVKLRIGINEDYQTYLSAGKIAQEENCAAVALHARTTEQLYSGKARWEAIARLKAVVTDIPVLGNGDIWSAGDALKMMRSTGCDGVIIGRGCLGRPWLFRDLVDAFEGRPLQGPPNLGEVLKMMLKHLQLLSEWFGEPLAMRSFRRQYDWYLKGFLQTAPLKKRMMQIATQQELKNLFLNAIEDPKEPFPFHLIGKPHGKYGAPQKVILPQGYLDNLQDDCSPELEATSPASGG